MKTLMNYDTEGSVGLTSLAVNEAASEQSEENENPDNYDTEGSVGLTSKDVDPNRGEKTALGHEREI